MSVHRQRHAQIPRTRTRGPIGALTRRASEVRRRVTRLLDGQGPRPSTARWTEEPTRAEGRESTIEDLDRRCAGLERDGDLPGLVQVLNELVVLDPRDVRRDALRDAAGRLLATSPGWLPRVPGAAVGTADPAAAAVLCLVDEAVAERQAADRTADGRRHRLLVAARMTGLTIAAMTPPEPSSPATRAPAHGGKPIAESPERDVDGITYHRTELGPEYHRITPQDVALEHEAWLASWLARRIGANVVHAVLGPRGLASGLVGVAVSDHLGTALVVEAGPPERLLALPERARERLLAAEAALLRRADVILIRSETERRALAGQMANVADLAADRIVVIPDPGGEGGSRLAGEALREAYARASAHRAAERAR